MSDIVKVKKPRLEWLDALRGFTMILVVANHVAGLGFGEEWKHSSAIPFLILFRMPLFFFVSGFLAYKASQIWDLKNFGMLVWKKVKVQTIPTVAFFFLAMAILNRQFWPAVETAFHSPLKGGYWFTIALLYMFIIYYVFSYLESKLRWKTWIPITLLFIVSIGFYETNYLPQYFSWAQGYKGAKTDLFYFLQDSSNARRIEMAYPAHDVGHRSADGVKIRLADHHLHVFPSLPAVFHQVYCHGRVAAIHRQANAGHLPDTLPVYARPASDW